MLSVHQDFCCIKAGLIINLVYPHQGLHQMSFVNCSCCGGGLVETKCPYSVKDDHPDILREKPKSFLNSHGLVMSHKYYTQVQGQLLVSQKQVDILISKNQALQVLYLKHCKYYTLNTVYVMKQHNYHG